MAQAVGEGVPVITDTNRLLLVKDMVDGIGDIDLHEFAAASAAMNGREEPTDDDYLYAIRLAIDTVMEEERNEKHP